MSKRTRVLIAVTVIELLLAGGWYYLHMQAVTDPSWAPEATARIGRVFGSAMGLVLGLSPVLYFFARRKDLADQARRNGG